jgi:hypothetical protein
MAQTGPVGPDSRRDSYWNLIFQFSMVLEFGKSLRNYARKFRRNLDLGIFPKFF